MKLYVLDFGSIELSPDVLVPGDGGGEWIEIGVPGYLIQTDDGANILVDSGLPRPYTEDPASAAARDGFDSWCRVRATAENLPAGQLARVGLAPADVTHLIVTHTHFDHAGGLGDFPGAIHVIQRAERELPQPAYPGFAWPERVRWQIVDGDTELVPGVELLATPGHTAGHLSVAVALPATGSVILAIDAIYLPLSLERDNFKASWNEGIARESGHRVARLAEERSAWLLFGHDPRQWATLNKAPAFYE
jgi:N-acyl homoserine lactone hydrolase